MAQRMTAKPPTRGVFVDYHRPKVGIEEARICSALVTDDVDAALGVVSLTVFPPACPPEAVEDVHFDASQAEGTWRWGKS
jgi:hypothetical protein